MAHAAPDSVAERADCAVCAALLRTSVYWWGWMLLCGLALTMLAAAWGQWPWLVLAWPLWLVGTWLTMRLMLDAALFHGLAQTAGAVCTLQRLDGALFRVLGVRQQFGADGALRPLASRVAGAMRLFRALIAVCVVHGLVVLAMLAQRMFNGG